MNPLITSAAFSQAGGGPGPAPIKITNQNRQDWNDYIKFLDSKGLKGNPSLDHNDLGMKMIDEYRKENPNTTISRDMVIPIQQEFSKYRDWALNQVKQGKAQLQNGVTPDKFLSALSIVDGIPGQRTTSYTFPLGYMKDMNTGQVQKKGFINTNSPVTDQLTSNP